MYHGGMYSDAVPWLLGALLAALLIAAARHMPAVREQWLMTVVMIAAAVGFFPFPLEAGHVLAARNESLAAALFLALVALSAWHHPRWLAVAFALHALWDFAWLSGAVVSVKPLWLVQLCVPFDVLVAIYLWRRAPRWRAPLPA